MDWYYEGEIFTGDDIDNMEGFVYLIENLINKKRYLGKKHFWKRQKSKKTNKRETKESNWRNYYGSCVELNNDVKSFGKENFKRTILKLCIYKKQMSFWEEKLQWDNNVLLEDGWYNTCIAGKYFVRENYIYKIPSKEVTKSNNKWREKASERMKGENNIAKKPEVRKKISEKKKGEKHHQYGKPISDDHRRKLHHAAHEASKRAVVYNGEVYESGTELRRRHSFHTVKYYKMIETGEIVFSDSAGPRHIRRTTGSAANRSSQTGANTMVPRKT